MFILQIAFPNRCHTWLLRAIVVLRHTFSNNSLPIFFWKLSFLPPKKTLWTLPSQIYLCSGCDRLKLREPIFFLFILLPHFRFPPPLLHFLLSLFIFTLRRSVSWIASSLPASLSLSSTCLYWLHLKTSWFHQEVLILRDRWPLIQRLRNTQTDAHKVIHTLDCCLFKKVRVDWCLTMDISLLLYLWLVHHYNASVCVCVFVCVFAWSLSTYLCWQKKKKL